MVKKVSAPVSAVFRFDCAAVLLADVVVDKNVGIAITSRIPMIRRTTRSSIKVKPDSPASACC